MTLLKDIDKILIIKLRAIGDVVMSTVVLDNLRAAFPKARIDFLTESESKDILIGNPTLNQVLVFDRKRIKDLPLLQRIKESRHLIKTIRNQNYNLVFDFFGNPRSAWLTWLSGAAIRVGYDYRIRKNAYTIVTPSNADKLHEVEWHLDALHAIHVPITDKKTSIVVGTGSKNFADSFWQSAGLNGQDVVAINFSGGWPAKRWPLDRFAHLIDILSIKYNSKILLIWGPGEKEQALTLQALTIKPTILIPDTNLTQLAAILSKVQLMVTTDSGPMHIAASVETPCVALFGPTNPKLQGPYGDIHQVVRKEGLDCLACNRLDCDHLSCMNSLSVKEVLKAVEKCVHKNQLFS